MNRKAAAIVLAALLFAGLLLGAAGPARATRAGDPASPPAPGPQVVQELKHDSSPALRNMPAIPPERADATAQAAELQPLGRRPMAGAGTVVDPGLQSRQGTTSMPAPLRNFDGINNRNGVLPPDTQGDVGPNHYIQWVNLSFQIWDKNGNSLYGPVAGNTLWQGFGGPCESLNNGDPITLYDSLADRWLMTQFALPNYPYGPFYECMAVSATPDPLGQWYRYGFTVHQSKMDDYPKVAVWPDGYYMTVNQFNPGWAGAGVFAFDRNKMLQGQAASFVYFDLYNANPKFGGMLPADLDGSNAPPAGAPAVFAEVDEPLSGQSHAMRLWQFHVDWTNPGASTFGVNLAPNQILPVNAFNSLCLNNSNCVPQKSAIQRLDGIGDRLMWRLQYRRFADHETLVVNHSVDVGSGRAGIRWYEVRKSSGNNWSIFQQGTFAPSDGLYRWMGSAAMDGLGNLAIGYSVSSSAVDPSIRYAGRVPSDPAGTLGQAETELIAGAGAQQHTAARWGDYSALVVDPVDNCTFWYTTEYMASTSWAGWQTRIGSFRFPTCSVSGQGILSGMVSNQFSASAIAGATVSVLSDSGQIQSTTTGIDGRYSLSLAGGVYSVTVQAFSYQPVTRTGVAITNGSTTALDLALRPTGAYPVSGTVRDAATGWPLYASLRIDGDPGGTIWNDPVTGFYSVTLPVSSTYTFHVRPWVAGYIPITQTIGALVAPRTVNFAAVIDPWTCNAPGYRSLDGSCQAQSGGLVVGDVADANTGAPLAGATVSDGGGSTTTLAGTGPNVPPAFYTLFAPAGTHVITATMAGGYGPVYKNVAVAAKQTLRLNFQLPAGRLAAAPNAVSVTVTLGAKQTVQLDLSNSGDLAVGFNLAEIPQIATALGPVERPAYALKPFRHNFRSARDMALYPAPSAQAFAAGTLLSSWTTGITASYGIALDARAGSLWLSSPANDWGGDNQVREFRLNGTATGRTHAFNWLPTYGPADLAYDWHTGKLWAMNIDAGVSNCIYEIDPGTGPTGHKICPGSTGGFTYSQRGLAYDPATDTWFAGGWNDFMIYHFDSAGRILDAVNTGLSVAGLAYNPDTHHLFAMTNNDPNVVYVLDAAHGYTLAGQFQVSQGFAAFGGAGLELDCAGRLWAVDQNDGTVYSFTSGESTTVCSLAVPWLSVTPTGGTAAAHGRQAISLTLASDGAAISGPGTYVAQLQINQDTPYRLPYIPVTMTVMAAPLVGRLQGTVTGLGYCDTPGPALAGAQVHVTGQGGLNRTLTTDGNGAYGLWLNQASSPLTVTVGATGYATQAASGIQVMGQATTTRDLALRRQVACLSAQPASITGTVTLGQSATQPLQIINHGAGPANFTLAAQGGGWLTPLPENGAVPADSNGQITITLNAGHGSITGPGGYSAILLVQSNDPAQPVIQVPVTMTVAGVIAHGVTAYAQPATLAGQPGTTVTYTLHITNTGNVSDTFTLASSNSQWPIRLPPTAGPVSAGQSTPVQVAVEIPVGTPQGTTDTATITVASQADPAQDATVTLTSRSEFYKLYLPAVKR